MLVDYDVFVNVRRLDAQDVSSLQKLYKAEDFDFRLKPGSAAVDKGTALPNVTEGFAGRAPDLGALEVGAAPSPLRTATVSLRASLQTWLAIDQPLSPDKSQGHALVEFVQELRCRVQVGVCRRQLRGPEPSGDRMQRPSGFELPRARFMTQVVEVHFLPF